MDNCQASIAQHAVSFGEIIDPASFDGVSYLIDLQPQRSLKKKGKKSCCEKFRKGKRCRKCPLAFMA